MRAIRSAAVCSPRASSFSCGSSLAGAVRSPGKPRQIQLRGLATKDLLSQRAERAKRELAILAQAFERYDGSGKGGLNAADLQKALADLELPAGEVDVQNLFAKLDHDRSGSVNLEEWLDNMPKGTKLKILEQADVQGLVKFILPEVKIVYTYTDEAPMLATFSLLPIFRAFCRLGGVKLLKKDISVAARILAQFPDYLTHEQRVEDDLEELGDLAKTPVANIIKLPNVSASVPQLTAAIQELQGKGYPVPDFPASPETSEEQEIQRRYKKVLGSAVNPVLREGNSDRRVAAPVKAYAQDNPHRVGRWTRASKSHVVHMTDGDFYGSEQSFVQSLEGRDSCKICFYPNDGGEEVILKRSKKLLPGEVIDGSCMNVRKLKAFYEKEIASTEPGVLFSLHLKATMMKVSDPVMFGKCVEAFYQPVFDKYERLFHEVGVNTNNGLGDVYSKLEGHPKEQEVKDAIQAVYGDRPEIAYVDSARGITNLHVPSDVIVDASMAAAIRDSGRMWSKEDKLEDCKFCIPDRSYAPFYQAVIADFQENGHLDVATCGATANVGLMAAKAEEYGSHDKTFIIPEDGVVKVKLNSSKEVIMEHEVEKGDIWRMCSTKDEPIQDWVKLAVNRSRATGSTAIFWLDPARAHDQNVIQKVEEYLKLYDTDGLDIQILDPVQAVQATLKRARAGNDTISVTGNVLRDYLTDLFPILELGTSAKMLSIVPLLAGGGMFETGAGGSAPKHVQQFVKEGHLRWDSLGEFLAMAVALEDLSQKVGNSDAAVLQKTLEDAVGQVMNNNKNPSRRVMELDNRGSHFYLALYWSEALAAQNNSPFLKRQFAEVAKQLRKNEARILGEMIMAEGKEVDIGGYWMPDPFLASRAMRPSPTFNSVIDGVLAASGF